MKKVSFILITSLCTTALTAAIFTGHDKDISKNMEEQNASPYTEAPVFMPPKDMLNSREKNFVKYLSGLHEKVFMGVFNAVQREQAVDTATRLHPKDPSSKKGLFQITPDMAVEIVLKSKRNPNIGKYSPQKPFGSR